MALAAHAAGVNVLPPKEDGTKAPNGRLVSSDGRWHDLTQRSVTSEELSRWYEGGRSAVGVVCGEVSGGLELLEFEGRAVDEGLDVAFCQVAIASGLGPLVQRISRGYLEMTPSGGYHLFYRCSETATTKLARDADETTGEVRTLIETKGEGGYAITAPSNGAVHPSGLPYVLLQGGWDQVATITPDERRALHDLARSLDRLPSRPKAAPAAATVQGTRPGDAFNERADWRTDVLEPAGWTYVKERDGVTFWRRPRKDHGVSATVGHGGHDVLYVFSSSTPFPEVPQGYEKFTAYTHLHHGGDFSAAATAAYDAGYRADSKGPDAGRFSIQSLADIQTRRVSWLWKGYIPFGKLTTAEGDPECGKSLFTADLAARGSTGRPMPDGTEVEPFATLLLCDEDDFADTVKPRLEAAGANFDLLYSLFVDRDEAGEIVPFFIPDDLPYLLGGIEAVREASGCDRVLVVVDPATAYLSEKINSNNDASVRRAMSPLGQMAMDSGAAVLLVRHLNKNSNEKNHKYRGGGSIAFFAAARASLMFGVHPDDPDLRVMAQAKKNISRGMPSLAYRIEASDSDDDQPVIRWHGKADVDASTVLNGRDARTASPDREEAMAIISKLLEEHGGQINAEDAFAACKGLGISKSTAKRARKDLGLVTDEIRDETGRFTGWTWSRPIQRSKVRIQVNDV